MRKKNFIKNIKLTFNRKIKKIVRKKFNRRRKSTKYFWMP